MHVAHEILAEWDEEEDAQDTTQQRADEYLQEGHGDLSWIRFLKDVEGWEGEDGTCHDHATAGANGLDDDILTKGILTLCSTGNTYCDDGNRNGGLEHLAHFKAEVGGCC